MLFFNSETKTFESSFFNNSVVHGFGTRMLGDGKDTKTILRFFKKNNISIKKLVIPKQVHGDNIVIFKSTGSEPIESLANTDSVISREKGVVLAVITADCLPILYSDEKLGIIGISHQGWRGTDKKLVQKVIKKMILLGASTDSVRVAIGPGIGACCYPRNLMKENFDLLVESGVKPEHIDYFPFCTSCDEERFFSYRKLGRPKDFPEQFSFILKTK